MVSPKMTSWLNHRQAVCSGRSMTKLRLESDNPALLAIRRERGLASKIALKCGITRNAVCMWKRVPPRHAAKVAWALRMPRHVVCPNIFPVPKKERKVKNATHN